MSEENQNQEGQAPADTAETPAPETQGTEAQPESTGVPETQG